MWYIFIPIIAFLILNFFSSCESHKSKDKNLKKVEQGLMSKVHYENHSYIVWSINAGGGIVHDPNCQCEKDK